MVAKLSTVLLVMCSVLATGILSLVLLAVCDMMLEDQPTNCMRQDECQENFCCVRKRDTEEVGKCLPYSNTDEFCEVIHNITIQNYHFCPCLDPKQVCRGRGFGGKCLIVNWNRNHK